MGFGPFGEFVIAVALPVAMVALVASQLYMWLILAGLPGQILAAVEQAQP